MACMPLEKYVSFATLHYIFKLYTVNLIFSVYCLKENLNQGKVTINENHPSFFNLINIS